MKRTPGQFFIPLVLILALHCQVSSQPVIRINQAGYRPHSVKCAVLASDTFIGAPGQFEVCDALTGAVLWTSRVIEPCGAWGPFGETYRLDFTPFSREGGVFLRAGNVTSAIFRVNRDVYDGAADFLLRYIRQQQCGYNPVLRDSCHTHDGFVTGDSVHEGEFVNVVGGWHDASDYLRYSATSAT